MKRPLLALILLCAVAGTTHAQSDSSYFGVGGATVVGGTLLPLVSVQIGGPLSESAELRVTMDTQLSIGVISADVLYTLHPRPDLKVYLGAGPNFALVFPTTGIGVDLHGTAGVEYRLRGGQGIGFYGEVKPFIANSVVSNFLIYQLRGGVNVHF